MMTDIPSGLKRPYEGEHERDWKRQTRSRDWRDVYMKKDSYKRDGSRDDSRSRGGYYRDDDYHHRHSTDRDRHRDRDRDRPRDRDGDRDRNRDRDRDRDRSKDGARERDRYGERSGNSRHGSTPRDRYNRSRSRPLEVSDEKPVDELNYKDRDSEMEEGEIVSVPPPPRRESSRERSSCSGRMDGDTEPPKPSPPSDPTLSKSTPAPPPKPSEINPEPEADLIPQEEEASLEQQIAARRARREAIRAKYASTAAATPAASQSPREPTPVTAMRPMIHDLSIEDERKSQPPRNEDADLPQDIKPISRSTSPAANDIAFSLAKDGPDAISDAKVVADNEQISAADYDPNLDRKEDEERRVRDIIAKNGLHENHAMDVVEEVVEEVEEEEDVDDMFAIATTKTKKTVKVTKTSTVKPVITTTTLDSAADPEGYYQIILGEQLDGGKYQVFSSLGKGMFSNVVRARTLHGEGSEIGKEVAIKIIRAQESMHRAGLKEVQIINKLRQADPDDKKHIVRLERTFEHRGHLCLVFESLSMNLRDVIKRFGKDVGLNIRAVRAYTSQLFLALSLLRKCSIMHADIKPDNILVSENKTVLKVCDFGSASDVTENDITPYLVSRFYRAPEIILGLPYDTAIDVWSIGCTLYELYTGKILFPGRSNNQMLLLMMELKGRFNSKMIKKAKFADLYFDEMGGFISVEKVQATGLDVTRTVHISKPSRDLRSRLAPPTSAKLKDEETKMVLAFIDLLDKCLALDPTRRLTPRDALMHPFVRGI